MTDRELTLVLRQTADQLGLPERFNSTTALIRATIGRRRKLQRRLASAAMVAALLATTAGVTVAAQGRLPWRSKQHETDTRQVAEAARAAEVSSPEVSELSLAYPVKSPRVESLFSLRRNPDNGETAQHTGVDFAIPAGETVTAAADGVVAAAGAYPELGNVVVISHGKLGGKAVSTWYAYTGRLLVTVGRHVRRGDAIVVSGVSGGSTGPHVHFEVRVDGEPVDPMPWLGK